jgi:hypothetical protein
MELSALYSSLVVVIYGLLVHVVADSIMHRPTYSSILLGLFVLDLHLSILLFFLSFLWIVYHDFDAWTSVNLPFFDCAM